MGMSRTMKSIITWVICLVVLAGVAVGGYFAYKATEKPRDPAPQTGALVVSHGELRDNAGKVIDLSQPLVVGNIYQVVNENEEGFSFKVNPENEGRETSITGVVGEAETLTIPGAMEINKDTYEVVSIEENAFAEATSLKNLYVADSIDTTSSNLSASFELQSASDVEGYDLYIKSVVVSFNANGGICETTSNELISGEVYGELPVATRTGYTFDGWYTALENGTKVESSTLVTATEDHTLYANWTAITYNVVLNENGGNNVDDLTYTVETTTLTLPTLTRGGYTFNGWFTAEVAGTKVESTDILSKLENQTYYAQWTANQFTVIFDSNKPADATAEVVGTMENQTFIYDALQNLTANIYSLEYYNFAGWSTTANGSVVFTDGQSVKNLKTEGSITLYAVWLADNERVITFEGNGVVVNPSTMIVTVGDAYGALPTLTRAGYTFDGWFTALENGTRIASTTIVPEGADHTLYAHWTINTYNVVLNENGGNNVENLTYTVETTTLTLPTLTKANYVFTGWFTAEVGGTKVESTDILSKLENQTYYAQWTPEEYDVILDENGGDLINDITYTIESEDITLPTPTRDGYTFIGWFGVKVVSGTTYYVGMDFLTTNNNALAYTSLDNTNLNDANKVVAIDCDVFAVNIGSGTLIAKWEEIVVSPIMVEVTFNANGGSVNPETATLTVGETYGTLPTPTRDGYAFDGWYTAEINGDLIKSTTIVEDGENHTLYAHWVETTAPIVTISRVDYNTFSWTASDNVGIAGYAITNSSAVPTSWTTTGTLTSGTKDISTANTWYVWVKDAAGNTNSSSIKSYEMVISLGEGTALTIQEISKDPITTSASATYYVLHGLGVYVEVEALQGYNSTQLKINDYEPVATGRSFTVNDSTTIITSSKANTYTVSFNWGADVVGIESVVVTYGQPMPTIDIPERSGYKFSRAYYIDMSISYSSIVYYLSDGTSARNYDLTKNITLTAVWDPMVAYLHPNWKNLLETNSNGDLTGITKDNIKHIKFFCGDPTTITRSSFLSTDFCLVGAEARDSAIISKANDVVVAYYYKGSDNLYYIGIRSSTNEQIVAPDNSSNLFAEMAKLEVVEDLGYNNSGVLDTSNTTNMSSMFKNCSKLHSPYILDYFNTSNVVDMSYMFYGCSGLIDLVSSKLIYNDQTGSWEQINYFANFNTSLVNNISYMFKNCSALEKIDLSYLEMNNIANATEVLLGCDGLKEIKTPLNLSENVEINLPSTFGKWCVSDNQSVAVQNFDSGMNNKTLLLRVGYLHHNWLNALKRNVSNVSTGITNGLINSISFERVMPSGYDKENYCLVGGEDIYTTLSDTNYNDNVLAYYKETSNGLFDIALVGVLAGDVYSPQDAGWLFATNTFQGGTANALTNCKTINFNSILNCYFTLHMDYLFYWMTNIEAIDMSTLNTENVEEMQYMFTSCKKLTNINLLNFNTGAVTDMAGMFESCESLQSIDLSDFNTENVEEMQYMFKNCKILTEIDLSTFNTKNTIYMYGMFESCESLETLDLSGFNAEKVQDTSEMFKNCKILTAIDFSNFKTENIMYMDGMFESCESLETLDLSSFNTKNVVDISEMLSGCLSLTSLDISSWEFVLVVNVFDIFNDCKKLIEINAPKSFTEEAETLVITLPTIDGKKWYVAGSSTPITEISLETAGKTLQAK